MTTETYVIRRGPKEFAHPNVLWMKDRNSPTSGGRYTTNPRRAAKFKREDAHIILRSLLKEYVNNTSMMPPTLRVQLFEEAVLEALAVG